MTETIFRERDYVCGASSLMLFVVCLTIHKRDEIVTQSVSLQIERQIESLNILSCIKMLDLL